MQCLDGNVVLTGRPNSISAGFGSTLSMGVALTLSKARSISPPDFRHFLMIGFTYLICLSMNPFPCGCRGLLVTWWIPQAWQKLSYVLKNCGPLSDTIVFGLPNMLRISFVTSMTAWLEHVLETSFTIGYRLK